MSTLLPLVRSTSQEKAASKSMVPDTHSSGQENLQQGGCLSGIGFMVSTSIASRLENLPTGHSNCMMPMRLPLKNKQYATLFSVYAPTLWALSTPADDKVIILGDFNARVGKDADS